MFIDYEKLVLADYHQKKLSNALPFNLIQPTPAKLKEECISACTHRFQKKDEKIIWDFFQQSGDQQACLKGIHRTEIEKFKPLISFLRGKTERTEEKNIQLLAWLIDFPDRPFEFGKKYKVGDVEEIAAWIFPDNEGQFAGSSSELNDQKERDQMIDIPVSNIIETENNKERRTIIVLIMGIILILLGGVFAFLWWTKKDMVSGAGNCMYWVNDHYEPIACDQKIPKTLIIGLDTIKIKRFKKIMSPDTITTRSIGLVWYSKIKNEVEFYTAEGYHPIEIRHRLKPLSNHMIETYIAPTLTPKE